VVVGTVQSNSNNAAANRLEVVEDTTDIALQGPSPVPVRDVADADGIAFVAGEGTNEVADVSVIEASHHISSCGIANGGIITAINVIEECRSANCRVAIAQTECIRVIIPQRVIANGSICNAANIEEKRVGAKSVVAVSVNVASERIGADSIVVPAKWEAVCERVIKQERIITDGRVAAGGKITIERSITNGGVWIAISVELERLDTNGGVRTGVIVMDECVSSNGHVLCAGSIEQQRCSANSGIGISSVEDQRSRATPVL